MGYFIESEWRGGCRKESGVASGERREWRWMAKGVGCGGVRDLVESEHERGVHQERGS
jgi:hypothetical protein